VQWDVEAPETPNLAHGGRSQDVGD
jgi:hypothetical protein